MGVSGVIFTSGVRPPLRQTELQRLKNRGKECEKDRVRRKWKTTRERKLRLEKVVASKQLRLAEETEEERRVRPENNADTKLLRLAMETDEERKAILEKMVATTQPMLAETEEERRDRLEHLSDNPIYI